MIGRKTFSKKTIARRKSEFFKHKFLRPVNPAWILLFATNPKPSYKYYFLSSFLG